ncbi:DUF4942 domain-containing protein [Crenobacter sp. SG2305]|uniref:DUF4942 domain-containing protein n=1 Tax=Crenobacter oryzisoli TaxID=3056844 RepID=UPI0025AB5668|nr:DUF4942 domain-containing protein [Crenobacter sp. SG2305]MDN0082436.1 DUF4942 domain-containing protein [Crenobacter sp. SG2305]
MNELQSLPLIERLLDLRDQAIAHALAAHDRLKMCIASCNEADIGPVETALSGGYFVMPIFQDEWTARAIAAIDAAAWDRLMSASGLFELMNDSTKSEWKAQITNLSTPQLTRENIHATFSALFAGKEAMFERGVVDTYRQLSFDPLAQQPVPMGAALKVPGMLDIWNEPDAKKSQAVDDLIQALRVLDGQPAPRQNQKIATTLRHAATQPEIRFENAYFSFALTTRTRAALLTFKQPALIERLNLIVAKFGTAVPLLPKETR